MSQTKINIYFASMVDAKVVERQLGPVISCIEVERNVNEITLKFQDDSPSLPWILLQISNICMKHSISR